MELEALAREIARADDMLAARTSAQLRLIAEQVRALQARARGLLEEARRQAELNRAACGFATVAGRTYHLYRLGDGRLRFSLLSPEEWGGPPAGDYVAPYRLERDGSWARAAADGPDPGPDEGLGQAERVLGPSPPHDPPCRRTGGG
jgi:hypothetical protein